MGRSRRGGPRRAKTGQWRVCFSTRGKHSAIEPRGLKHTLRKREPSPLYSGEGRVRGQRVAIWRGLQVEAFNPHPGPLPGRERENATEHQMTNLLWKEWHEQRWKLAYGCLMLCAFALIGMRCRVVADETLLTWVCFLGITLLPILASMG